MSIIEFTYLGLHAIATIGAIIGIYVKIERRLTRVETILEICLPQNPKTKELQ